MNFTRQICFFIYPMQPISSPSSSLFPGFAEYRLALAEQVEMAYIDNGCDEDHPPLVLLHGVFDNKATWFRLAARLPGRRLIAPDLIGHGHSSKPTFVARPEHERYSPDMQVGYLAAFIAALDLDDVILVGNSLGGGLALRLYLDFPALAAKVRGLVLIDAAGYPHKLPLHVRTLGSYPGKLLSHAPIHALARTSGLLRLAAWRTFRRCFHDRGKIPPELATVARAALETPNAAYAYHYSARNLVPPDAATFHQRFGDITCPTLVLWGQQDRVLPVRSAQRFAAALPHSDLHIFPNCGHAPHLEYPDETAAYIEQWIKSAI